MFSFNCSLSKLNSKLVCIPKSTPSCSLYVDGSSIVLKKYEPNCIFCGSSKKLVDFQDKMICEKCAEKIGKLNPNPYHKDHFEYDYELDAFKCPENQYLHFFAKYIENLLS